MTAENKSNSDNTRIWNDKRTLQFTTALMGILVIASIITSGFSSLNNQNVQSKITEEKAAEKTVDYINQNLLRQGEAKIKSTEDVGNLYQITISAGNRNLESYTTKDGKLLFPQGFNLEKQQNQ